MAHIHPEGWQAMDVTGAAQREIETLQRLAAMLSDDYTVFHGVHWTHVEQGFSAYGDIDFIISTRQDNIAKEMEHRMSKIAKAA